MLAKARVYALRLKIVRGAHEFWERTEGPGSGLWPLQLAHYVLLHEFWRVQ